MSMPFPGMDPYLEHPVLWPGLHTRLVVALANQLTPRLRPQYIASIEERVYIEGPDQQRIPDIHVQRVRGGSDRGKAPLEIHERSIEILDRLHDMRVVTVIELTSPSNKAAGPGRDLYLEKQRQTLGSECHLVEIDLLRRGRHVLSVPEARLRAEAQYDYLASVSRWPQRRRFELYPWHLRERMREVQVPLTAPDADVPLDLQAALEQVYADGSYDLRVRYDRPCEPPLGAEDQRWAYERWAGYRAAHQELFPPADRSSDGDGNENGPATS